MLTDTGHVASVGLHREHIEDLHSQCTAFLLGSPRRTRLPPEPSRRALPRYESPAHCVPSGRLTGATATLDKQWMDVALIRAKRGTPAPNPHVGAIVVHNGALVGAGHHERAGDDHAEVLALRVAGERVRDATLYVTLEPCNHYGRTPPCVDVIVRTGSARVVIGCRDPNPHVSGGGIEALRAQGIEVVLGAHEVQCRAVIADWAEEF